MNAISPRRSDPDPHPRYGLCNEDGPSGTCSLCTGRTQMGDNIIRELETGRPIDGPDFTRV